MRTEAIQTFEAHVDDDEVKRVIFKIGIGIWVSHDVLEHIATIKPPSSVSLSDSLGWLWNGGHDFSVNLGYDVRAHYSSAFGDGLWKIIHKFRGLERMKSFLWLVCKGCVLANSKRVRRHIASLAACVACGAVVEDLDHLLWQC
ncbi:hypothetical protein V6N11_001685 [Hibiscus sabdariffa]|uniref:Reverse transcriptase zinc-binding domain-containing protein n=1 Tax=Hibiscus sabdariffa TaxID=183260 RepID=A0ABR1Z8M2_9ROSI